MSSVVDSPTVEPPRTPEHDGVVPNEPLRPTAVPVLSVAPVLGRGRTNRLWVSTEMTPRRRDLHLAEWLFRSPLASPIWLIVRIWLGYEWLNAGYQKIWGSERAGFWFGGGAAVKGFASAGVAGSAARAGQGASYGWWAGFLHNFVVPNAFWIAKVVCVGEILIGLGLIVGLFTGFAALAGLSLNVIYMFSGTAGVNPAYAIASVFLVLAWRNSGWIGLDHWALRGSWLLRRVSRTLNRLGYQKVDSPQAA